MLFKPGSYGSKLSENFNIALCSMHTQRKIMCLKVLTFGHESLSMKTGS